MLKSVVKTAVVVAATVFAFAAPVAAQKGPVGQACAEEMTTLCAGKKHGAGEMRGCLEANKDKVSEGCKQALDSTGPGKGMGKGQGMGKGPAQ